MRTASFQKTRSSLAITCVIVLALFTGCGGEGKKEKGVDPSKLKVDSTRSNIINVGGELFSIPSPIQTALLIKRSGAEFKKDALNNSENAPSYTTKHKKALNLGVYGADLGYVTIYDQTDNALSYLNAVRHLSDELGIAGAFNKSLFERFNNNLGNEDSMLVLVSDAFKAGDAYLKNNDRHDVASLVLAGGWIEAVHFATLVALENEDEKVIERVGQQKTSLDNLINLLSNSRSPRGSQREMSDLISDLADLYRLFEDIEQEYTFKQPETKPEEKTTILKSETQVKITKEQLKKIADKVRSIRSDITG